MFAIVVNEKGGEQKRLEFDKPEVTIGRVQGNDIILPKGNVSKRHSRIVLKDGKFIIVDLKSTNGTYVNGRKITSPLVVKGSDKIYIGDFILSIEELQQQGVGVTSTDEPAGRPRQPTIPPPPPRKAPGHELEPPPPVEGDSGPHPGAAAEDEASEPQRPARPTAPPLASAPPTTSTPVIAARPTPAPPPRQSPSRVDLPAQPRANANANAAPVAAARPANAAQAAAPRLAPAPRPAPQRRVIAMPVDESKRNKLTDVMRDLSTRLVAALGVDSANVDATQEEDLWTRAKAAAREALDQLSSEGAIPVGADSEALLEDVVAETVAGGPIDGLLADEAVREILVSRYDRVFVDRGGGLQLIQKWFSSPEALTRVLERLLGRAGRQAELHAARASGGIVDARLDGGVLLSAALPPLAARGPSLMIRRPRREPVRLADLVNEGVMTQPMADSIELALKSRRNLIVCGPSGSGRSSLLQALARTAAEWGDRIVSVEDQEELEVEGAHVALVGRGAQARQAMQAAMHMRPDRLIVGDVRGPEAFDLVAAMAAGADGTLCAVQAASSRDAIARLAQLARLAPEAPSAETLREEVARAVHVIVHLARTATGETRVGEISEVEGGQIHAVFTFKPDAAGGRFAATGHVPAWTDGAPPSSFRA
jgi:pilus assembly protein CpaF